MKDLPHWSKDPDGHDWKRDPSPSDEPLALPEVDALRPSAPKPSPTPPATPVQPTASVEAVRAALLEAREYAPRRDGIVGRIDAALASLTPAPTQEAPIAWLGYHSGHVFSTFEDEEVAKIARQAGLGRYQKRKAQFPAIAADYAAGVPIKAICEKYDIDRKSVWSAAVRQGVPLRRGKR